jgi:hypothetical protein
MEHASVAAFARFTLDLLALGAPADLVQSAQQALGDEIAHAELCFGLAGATSVKNAQHTTYVMAKYARAIEQFAVNQGGVVLNDH